MRDMYGRNRFIAQLPTTTQARIREALAEAIETDYGERYTHEEKQMMIDDAMADRIWPLEDEMRELLEELGI